MTNPDRSQHFRSFFLHFRPVTVPERTVRFSLTWGLGGIATVLLLLLFGTGLLLKFVYEPVPAQAYASIVYLENQVPFGQLLRNLHRWSGYGLIVATFLHFVRVFYTGAFAPPRQFNWVIGLVLFGMVLLFDFTGYLLPWDQVAYWAITISTSMLDYVPVIGSGLKNLVLSGPEPGQATLINFYALHTAILPALMVLLLPLHFWRIRKADGLVILRSPSEQGPIDNHEIAVIPHLMVRELTTALIVIATVLLISMIFNAPLAEPANPGLSPNPTKAPWYFMGLQELLLHFHPSFAVLVIPLLTLAFLFAIPWIDPSTETTGVWFRSVIGRRTALIVVCIALVTTVSGILFNELVVKAGQETLPSLFQNGLLPFMVILVGAAVIVVLMKRAFSASRSEIIQALFTWLLTTFVALTITGIWFRGTGMQLTLQSIGFGG